MGFPFALQMATPKNNEVLRCKTSTSFAKQMTKGTQK
jgi:hypothetical protein